MVQASGADFVSPQMVPVIPARSGRRRRRVRSHEVTDALEMNFNKIAPFGKDDTANELPIEEVTTSQTLPPNALIAMDLAVSSTGKAVKKKNVVKKAGADAVYVVAQRHAAHGIYVAQSLAQEDIKKRKRRRRRRRRTRRRRSRRHCGVPSAAVRS